VKLLERNWYKFILKCIVEIVCWKIHQKQTCFSGSHLEDIAEEEEQVEEEEDADIGEEDEMADFIVDEEEVDENGAPVRYFKCMIYSLW
jgi:hypothetical protein